MVSGIKFATILAAADEIGTRGIELVSLNALDDRVR